jgi:hypothetical protein
MGIDGAGDGRAVVAIGDPDHAAHTVVFVPGANSDIADVPGGVDHARTLQRAADALTPPGDDVAAVYWLGYDAPTTVDALSYGPSRAGAEQFTPFVDGLRATHDASPSHITALGHSYGSTVLAEAALAGGLHVDDLVTAGSPGMHTNTVAGLHIDPHHVWAGEANDDLIGGVLGGLPFVHGQEPSDPAFGANVFVVDTAGHGGYWTQGSQSLHNQAAIIVGRYDEVTMLAGARPPTIAPPVVPQPRPGPARMPVPY